MVCRLVQPGPEENRREEEWINSLHQTQRLQAKQFLAEEHSTVCLQIHLKCHRKEANESCNPISDSCHTWLLHLGKHSPQTGI